MKQKGEKVVIEELKQRLLAKSAKLKRYEQRIHRYKVNRLFQQDQKRVYQEMNGTPIASVRLDLALGKANSFGKMFGVRMFYTMEMQNG